MVTVPAVDCHFGADGRPDFPAGQQGQQDPAQWHHDVGGGVVQQVKHPFAEQCVAAPCTQRQGGRYPQQEHGKRHDQGCRQSFHPERLHHETGDYFYQGDR